jgi:hypothetical protein
MLAHALAAGLALAPAGDAKCFRCHALPGFGYQEPPLEHRLTVEPQAFAESAHGKIACTACHPGAAELPHPAELAKMRPTCASECHATDEHGAPKTHAAVVGTFSASVHAKESADSPRCATCHGDAHRVRHIKGVLGAKERIALCADCHEDRARMVRNQVDPDAVASYRRSFHYKAVRFGARGTAVCQDCHTTHGALKPRDPAASVSPANIERTCSRAGCHTGGKMSFAMSGANHLDLRIQRTPLLRVEEHFFRWLTIGSLGALGIGLVFDVQRRLGWLELVHRFGRLASALATRAARQLARAASWLRRFWGE